jgi:hypothetical protein
MDRGCQCDGRLPVCMDSAAAAGSSCRHLLQLAHLMLLLTCIAICDCALLLLLLLLSPSCRCSCGAGWAA